MVVISWSKLYLLDRSFYHNSLQMRIQFDLRKITGHFNYKGKIRLRVKIGQDIKFVFEPVNYNEGYYAFMEKMMANTEKLGDQTSVQLSILAQTGVTLAHVTIFLVELRHHKPIEIRHNQQNYLIDYVLREMAQDMEEIRISGGIRTSSNETPDRSMIEEQGKIQILKMSKIVFDFLQKLDPVMYIYQKIYDLVNWTYPYKTITVGMVLTLMIYNIKLAIFVAGVLLYFGRTYLFRRLYRLQYYRTKHHRLAIPQQNILFLQIHIEEYCLTYEKVCEFFFSQDKTVLVNIINLFCKLGFFLIVMLFFFDVEHIIVIVLWTTLLMTSPYRNNILKYLKPFLEFVVGEYSKIVGKISSGISNVMGKSHLQATGIQKQFYFYKYERWWVMGGWKEEKKKFSDQEYQCLVFPRELPPDGWAWIEQWKIDYEGLVDSDGFQYANDIKKEFKPHSHLATLRRRKWKRVCCRLKEQ